MNKKLIVLSITIASWTRRLSLSLSLLLLGSFLTPCWGQTKEVEIVGNPTVNEEQITLRIQVTGEVGRPVMGLLDTDFSLKVVDLSKNTVNEDISFDWKSPEEAVPPPAWIIILLDLSGSMAKPDSRGTTKIEGAIKAIRKFTELAELRGGNTQVSIVPFGEPGPDCLGYPVNKNTLDNFSRVDDAKLQIFLDNLANRQPCASTNLYEPLNKTIRFLANKNDLRFYPSEDSPEPQPRLSIILLSDGYHNKANEAKDFQTLSTLLKRNDQIIVHTLGYGLTPQQLGQKYKLSRPATRRDVNSGQVPEEEFVDEERLAEIAKLTGGIAEFSGEAEAIAENLQLFLNALLGEYEISYFQPNPERGKSYQVSIVVQKDIKSQSKEYRITVFGRALPFKVRILMLLSIVLILGIGGVIPFYFWGQWLKEQAME